MTNKFTIDQFLAAHKQGLTDRAMGKLFGVHHNTIAYHRRRHQLPPNGTTRQPLERLGKNKARCSKCKKIKSLDQYISNRKGQKYEYKVSYCHNCRKAVLNRNLNRSIEKFLADRFNRLVIRCREKGYTCNITYSDLLKQYYKQAGKCFYTDIPLAWGVGYGPRRDALSIDKIVPGLGYISGNVVLCTYKANTVKCDLTLDEIAKWLPSWYKRILKFSQIPNRQSN